MTAAEFRILAEQIAGPDWRNALPNMIGRSRWMVWAYAGSRCEVPETVAKLMALLAA